MQRQAMLFFGTRDSLQHQYQGTPRPTDVDGLIRRIEHQDRHLQDVVGVHRGCIPGMRHGPGNEFLFPCVNHGFTQRHPSPVKKMLG